MATEQRLPTRERRPSMGRYSCISHETRPLTDVRTPGAPIVDIVGSVGPAGISRPKHKRTYTGFGAGEVKSVEGNIPLLLSLDLLVFSFSSSTFVSRAGCVIFCLSCFQPGRGTGLKSVEAGVLWGSLMALRARSI